MRIVKEHDERKNEIIDTAAALFIDKGYDQCSINDILNSIGIAKGTFYHYFKSKEDVLDAAVNKMSEQILIQVQEIAAKKEIPPLDRIIQVLLAIRVTDHTEKALIQEMHKMQNALLHQKTLVSIITTLTPVFTEIVKEGNTSGIFQCKYPEESIQILLSATLTLLDDGIFQLDKAQTAKVFEAIVYAMEKMLGVNDEGFFERMCEYWKF